MGRQATVYELCFKLSTGWARSIVLITNNEMHTGITRRTEIFIDAAFIHILLFHERHITLFQRKTLRRVIVKTNNPKQIYEYIKTCLSTFLI